MSGSGSLEDEPKRFCAGCRTLRGSIDSDDILEPSFLEERPCLWIAWEKAVSLVKTKRRSSSPSFCMSLFESENQRVGSKRNLWRSRPLAYRTLHSGSSYHQRGNLTLLSQVFDVTQHLKRFSCSCCSRNRCVSMTPGFGFCSVSMFRIPCIPAVAPYNFETCR